MSHKHPPRHALLTHLLSGPRGRTLPVLLAAVVLIGGANVAAYAVNGRPLLLGSSNTETRPAVVKNTGNGPALSLRSKAGAPSLAVSSKKKVKRLNADLLDGLDSSDLRTVARRYAVPSSGPYTSIGVGFPDLAPGRYLASYTIITSASSAPQCYFREATPPSTAQALTWGVAAGGFNSNNATALLDSTGGPITLTCAGGSFSFYSNPGDADSSVVFTPVDGAVDTAVGPAPRASHRQQGGKVTSSR